ncbi:hypothetical protein K2P97_08255 [bacterium]|nr:hypothetical protein [bacterium]
MFGMKKYYVGFAIVGLFVGYFAKVNYWFEDEKDVFFPISKEQLRAQKNKSAANAQASSNSDNTEVGSAPTTVGTPAPTPVALERLSQYELFNELYNSKVLTEKNNHNAYFEKIKSRLTSPYPFGPATEHKSDYEKEVANRLGLLKAMASFWPTPKQVSYDQKEIKKFFFNVASNKKENLMVRRQAYKNWLSFGDSVASAEKSKFLAVNDSELLHLISMSDDALAESLTESAE